MKCMANKRVLGALLLGCVVLAGGGRAQAAETIEKGLASTIGKAVLIFCRPSSPIHGITLTSYSIRETDDDFYTVRAGFDWKGALTENP